MPGAPGGYLVIRRAKVGERVLANLDEDLALVAEVHVEGRRRQADFLGDFADGRALITLSHK